METVAFYSYKGGVGRSLLLKNAAHFLANAGKKVVAIDFDLEAPGLHYKFGVATSLKKGGAVPYLIDSASGAVSRPSLKAHIVTIKVSKKTGGQLLLMPAGPAPQQSYWAALKDLGEKLRFNDPSGSGFMALLDLQARIAEELKPDYLLIDARTGVTELSGLATTLLADTVICMFIPNHESVDGTLAVAKALKAAPRLTDQQPIRVIPFLTRVTKLPRDRRLFRSLKALAVLCIGYDGEVPTLRHDSKISASDFPTAPHYRPYQGVFKDLFPAPGQPRKHTKGMIRLNREDLFFKDVSRFCR
jgi:hypothetical protein